MVPRSVLALLALSAALHSSLCCQSSVGISRSAIRWGLNDKPTPASPEVLPTVSTSSSENYDVEDSSESHNSTRITIDSTTHDLAHYPAVLVGIPRTLKKGLSKGNRNQTVVRYYFPVNRNVSMPMRAQSLTKAKGSAYIGFKFLNFTADPNDVVNTAGFLDQSVEMLDEKLTKPARKVGNGGPETHAAKTSPASSESVELTEDEEDQKVNEDWGGECGSEHWKACYNITVVGKPTLVHPLFPKDRKKNQRTQMDCFNPMEAKYFPWLCLRNGWTVNRCHIYCMSKCNRDLLYTRKWDYYVLHEGACKTK